MVTNQKSGANDSLRDAVLAAARTLFMEHGYDAIGMRDIARAVGRQPVQIYRLKLSKTDILAELTIQLNQEQINQIPDLCARVSDGPLFQRASSYLRELYGLDIKHLPIRSVSAAFGWSWSADYECRVIEQVFQLIDPLVRWMTEAGLGDIPARCFGIWSLYYVGFRHAVMQRANADECLAVIQPSLRFYFDEPDRTALPSC